MLFVQWKTPNYQLSFKELTVNGNLMKTNYLYLTLLPLLALSVAQAEELIIPIGQQGSHAKQDINVQRGDGMFDLRERFDNEKILLCFNGPISRSLIEEIGNALRNYMKSEQASPAAALDVFAVYIELTQNIRHYCPS